MKIFCIGRNYAKHAKEMGAETPSSPVVFMKPSTALLIENKPFYIPEFSEDVHHEIELIVKICKNGKHVQPAFASSYYEKIGLGIDFTARDVQKQCKEKGHPWELAKAFDHSAVVGRFFDKKDLDMDALNFSLKKNGEDVQIGYVKDMLFSIDELICYLSKFFTLQTGDLIFTGTPEGVGPVQIGDKLEGLLSVGDEKESCFNFNVK